MRGSIVSNQGVQLSLRATRATHLALPVPYYPQSGTYLCWAACAEMLIAATSAWQSQCDLARLYAGTGWESLLCDPVPGPAPSACPDDVAWPNRALYNWGVECPSPWVNGHYSLSSTASLIQVDRRPLLTYWSHNNPRCKPKGGGGHMGLIVDVLEDGWCVIHDPRPSAGGGWLKVQHGSVLRYGNFTWCRTLIGPPIP